jgi:hypothetical protein
VELKEEWNGSGILDNVSVSSVRRWRRIHHITRTTSNKSPPKPPITPPIMGIRFGPAEALLDGVETVEDEGVLSHFLIGILVVREFETHRKPTNWTASCVDPEG